MAEESPYETRNVVEESNGSVERNFWKVVKPGVKGTAVGAIMAALAVGGDQGGVLFLRWWKRHKMRL